MYNLPTTDSTLLSLGPGRIYIGVAGTTPSTDVGAVRSGMNFAITRTKVPVKQGNPPLTIKTFVTEEAGILTLTGLEWDFDNMAMALGQTTTTVGNTFDMGGDLNIHNVALKLVHVTPSDHTVTLYIWNAEPRGDFTANFTDEPHEFEMGFEALLTTVDWAGGTLATGDQMFKLFKETA